MRMEHRWQIAPQIHFLWRKPHSEGHRDLLLFYQPAIYWELRESVEVKLSEWVNELIMSFTKRMLRTYTHTGLCRNEMSLCAKQLKEIPEQIHAEWELARENHNSSHVQF